MRHKRGFISEGLVSINHEHEKILADTLLNRF